MAKKYAHLKDKARKFRKQGMAISEICERLSMKKGTVYYWIKDIPLKSRTKRQTESQRKASEAHSLRCREKREQAYCDGLLEGEDLMGDSSFRDFVVVYLTEGYRRTIHQVSVANSNSAIVRLAFGWIRKLTDAKPDFSIQCHVDNDEDELKQYWADELGIDSQQIKVIRRSNSGSMTGRNWRSTKGVFTVRVNDTYLRARLQAWMDMIQKKW